MPRYRVTETGVFGNVMYSPRKRNILTTDKPFKKDAIPSWVDPKPLKDGDVPAARSRSTAEAKEKAESMAMAGSAASVSESTILSEAESVPDAPNLPDASEGLETL